MPRSYDQFCALAQALDRVGSRWALLVIRELLVGPARFVALKDALTGVSTNLLTERLRELEADGIVARSKLPPPASVDVYELTPMGRELGPAVAALALWGARFMPEAEYRPPPLRGAVLAARAYLAANATAGLRASVVYEIGLAEPIHIEIDDGTVTIGLGELHDPDARVTCDPRVFLGMTVGLSRPSRDGTVQGSKATVARIERAYDRSRSILADAAS